MDVRELTALAGDLDKACSVDGDGNWSLNIPTDEAALLMGAAAGMLHGLAEDVRK